MTTTVKEFTAQRFEFRCEVAGGGPVVLNQHKGSALRGALFNALRRVGCSQPELKTCQPCQLVEVCPVSFLLATVDEAGRRGSDVPRPFTIQPPLGPQNIFQPGEAFNFGLTLFARSINFLPYLLVALQELEREGLGAKSEYAPGRWGRGRLRLRKIVALNPLSGQEQSLFETGRRSVEAPETPVTTTQVAQLATVYQSNLQAGSHNLRFRFHTPTRLVVDGQPLRRPDFPALAQRLIERLSSLSAEYGAAEWELDFGGLMEEARAVRLVEDRTAWAEVRGYSQRQQQDLTLSGFMGEVVYRGQVPNLLPLLLWGQLTHVGKDSTKGNGWYSLSIE